MLTESAPVPNSDSGKNRGLHVGSARSSSACSQTDPESYLIGGLPGCHLAEAGADFRMTDFLRFAGVEPGDTAGAEAYLRMTEASLP